MAALPLLKDVRLTALGNKQIHASDVAIKCRERQFLLLLDCRDSVSQQVCAAMLPKVDLQGLVQLGLLEIKNQEKYFDKATKAAPKSLFSASDSVVTRPSNDGLSSTAVSWAEPNPMLQLAAGVV
ncbi:hypothetical protein [Psychrobacter ciconiae]|uniref:hypothetical protein n=1 Tax=Psychrobacter ciconiae TaxID=1553449 RepID=UPI001917BA7F|nr:hypothetical protein [Psychrobacter ciconiae]